MMQDVCLPGSLLRVVLVLAAWTAAATPVCQMNIQGTGGRAVRSASLVCEGGTITAAADKSLLAAFVSGFQGVVWDKGGCGRSKCLLTICGNTTAKFDRSSIKNLNASESLVGILCVIDDSVVSFEQSMFASNTAVNGTLHIRDRARVAFLNSEVVRNIGFGSNTHSFTKEIINGCIINTTQTQEWNGKGAGAGIHAGGFAQVTLSGTHMSSNKASSNGGALWVEGNAKAIISNSTIHNNSAGLNGGGLHAKDLAMVLIANYSTFSSNIADNGGGAYAGGNASITVANSSTFSKNRANYNGGGACAQSNANITVINSSTFSNNNALNGGGAIANESASIIVAHRSTFSNNSASCDGGGAHANDSAIIMVANSSTFSNNSALKGGGGALADGNACLTVVNSSSFSNNSAVLHGGGFYANGKASITIVNNSTLTNNSAREDGGGAYANGNARITVANNSTFSNNSADNNGGGAYAYANASIIITNSSTFSSNSAHGRDGGGAYANGNASITVANSSTFSNNSADNNGGGACAYGTARIMVAHSSTFGNNNASNGGGLNCQVDSTCQVLDSYIYHHTVAGVGAGLRLGDNAKALIQNSTMMFNSAFDGGAIYAHSPKDSRFKLTIGNKSHIAFNNATNGGGMYLSGGNTTIGPGVEIEGNRALTGAGVYFASSCSIFCKPFLTLSPEAQIRNNTADLAGGGIFRDSDDAIINDTDARQAVTNNTAFFGADLLRSRCNMGEVIKGKWCERCGSNLYSLDPNKTECEICPVRANCTGDVISPEMGYWHSDNYSTQIHRCPNPRACSQGRGTDKTRLDWQCAEGYTGNLCGKCVSNDTVTYGFNGGFKCGRCLGTGAMITLLVVSLVFILLLNILTVHCTYQDNLQVVDKSDVWPSDVIKILVLYLQYLIIISSAPLKWPESLSKVFFAISWVFAAGNSQAVSLDCIYSHLGLPLAIKRLLTYLIGPFIIVVAVMIVYCLFWLGRGAFRKCLVISTGTLFASQSLWNYVSKRVPAIVLVVLYAFSYPSLVKVGWSMFACYRIDDPDKGVYRQYLQANGSYWVYDIQEPCWSRNQDKYHFIWALSFGIPTLLVF
eukprot:jgi/Chrzof1/3635/Cz13g03080.t1